MLKVSKRQLRHKSGGNMTKQIEIALSALELDKSITQFQIEAISAVLEGNELPSEPRLLTQQQVAMKLGCSRQTVYALKKSGVLRTTKLHPNGNDYYYTDQINRISAEGM